MSSIKPVSSRLSNIPDCTVWSEMTPLAVQCKAVNLGQGFPNFTPPQFLIDYVKETVSDPGAYLNHQYARSCGNLVLVAAIRRLAERMYGRPYSDAEVLVTAGASQGMSVACNGLISPGDEAIIFTPAFDLYANDIEMAGGKVVYAVMKPAKEADEWGISEAELRALITPRTKLLILNTPQNVPGKVWSAAELEMIAALAIEHNFYVVTDEVYHAMVFDGKPHASIATVKGMEDRAVVVNSAGKTFSCTGYKVGWILASPSLVIAFNKVQAHQTFCIATPLQIAVGKALAHALEPGCTYFKDLAALYDRRRGMLCKVLDEAGLTPVVPSGSFFVVADISKVAKEHYMDPNEKEVGLDWQFCRWLTRTIGVNAIPVTAFCTHETRHIYESYVRFAFCKTDEDIIEGGKRLMKLRNYMKEGAKL